MENTTNDTNQSIFNFIQCFCEADNQIRNKQWHFQINSFLISGPSHHIYISESENEWFCQYVFFVIVRYSNKSLFF